MTAPISNEPTTTRLHHYAGRYSTGRTGLKEKTPMHELLRDTVKYYSPQHAQIGQFSTIMSMRGRFLFQ